MQDVPKGERGFLWGRKCVDFSVDFRTNLCFQWWVYQQNWTIRTSYWFSMFHCAVLFFYWYLLLEKPFFLLSTTCSNIPMFWCHSDCFYMQLFKCHLSRMLTCPVTLIRVSCLKTHHLLHLSFDSVRFIFKLMTYIYSSTSTFQSLIGSFLCEIIASWCWSRWFCC